MKKMRLQNHGQAMVEFALVIPLLIFILMGIFDLGMGVYSYNVVASAAREGAHYGTLKPTDTTGIQNQAKARITGLNPSYLGTIVVECSDNGTSFSSACSTSRTFIRVTVPYTFHPISAFFTTLPLTGKSMMSIEK